ncbi:hypothetical protein BJV78DRAFT_274954 [Lactifluus subvellereus]|nr:hypothetical protein BJV78DRAFT_274954 [Lactifluus subvellereus]
MFSWNTALSWDGVPILSRNDARVVKRWWKCSYMTILLRGYDLGPRYSPSPVPSHLPEGCRDFQEIVKMGVVIVSWESASFQPHPFFILCSTIVGQSATAVYRPDKSRWRLTLLTPSSDPPEDHGQDTRYFTVINRGTHTVMATLIPPPRGRRFLKASLSFLR